MTLSASKWVGRRLLGLIYVFLPWLRLKRGSLEPFMGRPFNLGRLDSRVRVGRLEPLSPVGLGTGRSSFMRHPVRCFLNWRG